MIETGLVVDNVSKVLSRQTIVHPISFRVPPGKILALCGGNGAGKSTILRMIVGITRPTTGLILFNGDTWVNQRQLYARQIGYMPDDVAFPRGLNVEETLGFYAGLRGLDRSRVTAVLETVGLGDARTKGVGHLSKGMRQRLLFAQAILSDPRLLVLDEPTNGLDPYWMDFVAERLIEIKNHGQTVVLATHQLDMAEAVADEVVFLDRGRVMSAGSIASFRERFGPGALGTAFKEAFKESFNRAITAPS